MTKKNMTKKNTAPAQQKADPDALKSKDLGTKELGGRKGPEPTRYGDWENNGIISDF